MFIHRVVYLLHLSLVCCVYSFYSCLLSLVVFLVVGCLYLLSCYSFIFLVVFAIIVFVCSCSRIKLFLVYLYLYSLVKLLSLCTWFVTIERISVHLSLLLSLIYRCLELGALILVLLVTVLWYVYSSCISCFICHWFGVFILLLVVFFHWLFFL